MQIGGIQSGTTNLAAAKPRVSKFLYQNPKDTNGDGFVDAAEAFAYSLKHPELELLKDLRTTKKNPWAPLAARNDSWNQYSKQGVVKASGSSTGSRFDRYA